MRRRFVFGRAEPEAARLRCLLVFGPADPEAAHPALHLLAALPERFGGARDVSTVLVERFHDELLQRLLLRGEDGAGRVAG